MKVFIGIKDVAGIGPRLQLGFHENGVDCALVNLFPFRHHDVLQSDNVLPFIGLAQFCTRQLHIKQPKSVFVTRLLTLVFLLSQTAIYLFSLFRYDAYVFLGGATFFYDRSFLQALHLKLLSILGKTSVVVYYGSDSRPDYIDGALPSCVSTAQLARNVADKKARIVQVDQLATYVIDFPGASHFHVRSIIDEMFIGLPAPIAQERQQRSKAPLGKQTVRILHAPSDLGAKGTEQIRSIMARLRADGLSFEYVEISGQSRAEVFHNIANCDFVVDQVYSDHPFPSFSTEAASCGKPSVLSGYFSGHMDKYSSEGIVPPCLFVHPDALMDNIRNMIMQDDVRRELGVKALEFSRGRGSAKHTAARILDVMKGEAPQHWLLDPGQVQYAEGCALSQERARKMVRDLISEQGVTALQLGDKPELERTFVEFSGAHEGASSSL